MMKNSAKRLSRDDRVFYAMNNTLLFAVLLVVLYPLIYVVACSFSKPAAVMAGKVFLWPVDFSVEGYRAVFQNRFIGIGYKNTIIYTAFGTVANVALTMMAAYPLARKDMPFRGFFMFLFTFTMFFSGGMIPNYILMIKLNLIDNRLSMILPGLIVVYNLIIARTFIQNSIPGELLEASQIDGCDNASYFFRIVLPLSGPILAVLALYYAVGHWNAYFNAFMYLNDRNKYPLQIFLREILIANQMTENMDIDPELLERKLGLAEVLKYALIIVSTAPVLCLYPFLQRYFVKGVMIGSVKG